MPFRFLKYLTLSQQPKDKNEDNNGRNQTTAKFVCDAACDQATE
jgi:hypothetical protein